MTSKFLKTLEERGFYQDCTDRAGIDSYLENAEKSGKPGVAYIGFDCTASSLHAGSLMQIMILRWLQKLSHKPVVLLGGGTTKIGDPSGKDESRKMLDEAGIERNKQGIKKVFEKFLKFGSGASDAILVDNDEWLSGLNYIKFLRDIGPHFSINRMLTMESVKRRLEREQNLSFLEFNYMILQAYDFVELANKYNCRIQIGGSDQWGNIVNGTDLSHRLGRKEVLFGLTTPLLTTSSGAKMGKTADGAVWLDADLLSPYDYWQYWRNTADADVIKFLKLFTELSLEEISELQKLEGSADINKAKIILANKATELLHGADAAKNAEETARKVFEQGGIGGDLPVYNIEPAQLDAGISIAILFKDAGLTESNGEAKKLVQGGGARINDEKISDIGLMVNSSHLKDGVIKLSAGKKKHALVKVK